MFLQTVLQAVLTLAAYIWPGYQCFKALEKRRPEELRCWCEYWLVIATFASVERLADFALWWLPMYNLLKILSVVYLWHPKTQGASLIYRQSLQPFLAAHEARVDRAVGDASRFVTGYLDRYFGRVFGLLGDGAVLWLARLRLVGPAAGKGQKPQAPVDDATLDDYVNVAAYGDQAKGE
ncbi:unnamed protein product [Ostreobium quekettii]|uniref:HVA22-like protein n=1 Tax=Ostreobium quekettii TaxID=121088 RepID=A0A8S1J1N7_9CHLO|nr:unnamed protein product [Ostreobium quekettii]